LKRNSILLIVVGVVLVGLLVWRAGFYIPPAGINNDVSNKVDVEKTTDPCDLKGETAEKPSTTEKAADPCAVKKAKIKQDDPCAPTAKSKTNDSKKDGKKEPEKKKDKEKDDDKDDELESVNLNEVEVKKLIDKLAQWTGKVIIPDAEALKQKITIYSSKKLSRIEAMARIYDALRTKGFIAEETDGVIFIKPIKDAKLGQVPTLSDDDVLALIENKNQIVQKFFQLRNFSPTQLNQIVKPLIPEYGHVYAIESTSQLVVIDTVSNLMRIGLIIEKLDVPEAEDTVTRIFEIRDSDPAKIVQLLRVLFGQEDPGRSGRRRRQPPPRREPAKGGPPSKGSGAATSVVIGPSSSQIVLIPMMDRGWIIARASADDMKQIGEWIEKLDTKRAPKTEHQVRKIEYANAEEVANQINRMIQQMPGEEIKANVLVVPLEQARQVMIVGSEVNRKMVEKLIAEIDVPVGVFETGHFKLKYADPEKIKEYIDELYSDQQQQGGYYNPYRYYSSRRQRGVDINEVKVIAYTTLKEVTVIASAENLAKITEQIAEWDKPLNVKEVAPLIIELKNSDPVKLTALLTTLFSEKSSGRPNIFDYIFRRQGDEKKKIVGPLYGQLTFEAVPDTKKIIVISKIPEAYEVIKELVLKLDSQEPAELPMVVTLKYADSEDLCDQLNAILNEPGTRATILRRRRGLSDYTAAGADSDSSNRNQDRDQAQSSAGELVPWWTVGTARSRIGEEMPISNIIGKIRFIPVHRSKAILVLSPKEYQDSIEVMIEELDKPGKQVMIKAVIVEVNHEDMTSLGVQIATNPDALGTANEDAITAITNLIYSESPGSSFAVSSTLEVNALIDLLIKKTNGRVLNQPTLWTGDNEEAEFFKGRRVAFRSLTQTPTQGQNTIDSFKYEPVGLTLRVRPNITPENSVDMTIYINISQVEPELVNGEVATSSFSTTTNMILADGQTVLISGILFQKEIEIKTKVPFFGDIPLLGELFKHNNTVQSNSELLAFITPYVIDSESDIDSAGEELEKARQRMQDVKDYLEQSVPDDQQDKKQNLTPGTNQKVKS
jgi:general secretion pathway protein D